jgi:hypothetical protein
MNHNQWIMILFMINRDYLTSRVGSLKDFDPPQNKPFLDYLMAEP